LVLVVLVVLVAQAQRETGHLAQQVELQDLELCILLVVVLGRTVQTVGELAVLATLFMVSALRLQTSARAVLALAILMAVLP